MSQKNVDLTDYFSDSGSEPVTISAGDRLRFARQVLFGLAAICVGFGTAYTLSPENRALIQIFELIKIGAFPILTLVISFYFPNSSRYPYRAIASRLRRLSNCRRSPLKGSVNAIARASSCSGCDMSSSLHGSACG